MPRRTTLRLPTLTLLIIGVAGGPAYAQTVGPGEASIAIIFEHGAPAISVQNLPEALLAELQRLDADSAQWGEVFSVQAGDGSSRLKSELPNVLGRYSVQDGQVIFAPRYPLSTRTLYSVEFRPKAIGYDSEALSVTLRLDPGPATADTLVRHIYPSADVLPANLLKFYIEFSRPMSRGMGTEYIHLLRSDGTTVEDPFPEIGVELWDTAQRRFTLLLDPGRIKRGIRINEEMGLPLVPGGEYRLEIDAAWPDADGKPLAEGYAKVFSVTEPDHTSPDPASWSIEVPAAGSRDPVAVIVPESLDAALMERLIWLVDPDAKEVSGRVKLENDERRWLLHPDTPWIAGAYSLRSNPRLEDLAGNQIRRPFERDVNTSAPSGPGEEVNIPVVIH